MAGGATARAARAAETAVALKDAARRVFARRGYLNTKIVDITTEAGRSAGSFYNHFSGKDALLQALLADAVATADARAGGEGGPIHGEHDLADPAVLRSHVEIFWRTYRDHLPEIAAMQQAALVDPGFARWVAAFREAEALPLRAHLEDLRDRGFALPGPPALVALAMASLLEQFCHRWATAPVGDEDAAIDTLTGLLHRGIVGVVTPP